MCARTRRVVAIAGARAVDVHVALRHVVKNAIAGHAIAVRRIAGRVAARAVLRGGKLVINWVRITLARTHLLVHDGLDASHDGRRERCPAGSRPTAGIAGARGTAVQRVRPAKHVVVTPKAVRSEERNVGSVTHAVIWIANESLPRRLGPSLASAAHHSGNGRRTGRTSAWTTAARNGCLKR